jgi:hypothetical protein
MSTKPDQVQDAAVQAAEFAFRQPLDASPSHTGVSIGALLLQGQSRHASFFIGIMKPETGIV